MADEMAPEPMSAKAKQVALRLMREGMDLAGQWRHADAVAAFDQALALVPRGLFAKMAWELKGHALRTLGRNAEAEAAYNEAQRAREESQRSGGGG